MGGSGGGDWTAEGTPPSLGRVGVSLQLLVAVEVIEGLPLVQQLAVVHDTLPVNGRADIRSVAGLIEP